MTNAVEIFCLVLVGAFWGCTNPILRKGATTNTKGGENDTAEREARTFWQATVAALQTFKNVKVWLPFALNQAGSLLYYVSLSKSDLSLAVPICNGLALVFSMVTSYWLGERVDKPVQTMLGSTLVVSGVALCLISRLDETDNSSAAEL